MEVEGPAEVDEPIEEPIEDPVDGTVEDCSLTFGLLLDWEEPGDEPADVDDSPFGLLDDSAF